MGYPKGWLNFKSLHKGRNFREAKNREIFGNLLSRSSFFTSKRTRPSTMKNYLRLVIITENTSLAFNFRLASSKPSALTVQQSGSENLHYLFITYAKGFG